MKRHELISFIFGTAGFAFLFAVDWRIAIGVGFVIFGRILYE
jgi:hypothetical protein